MDDLAWLDEERENNEEDKDFLDITTLSNEITSIVVDNEFKEKRQRVDSSSSVDKGKGPVVMWMRPEMISIRRMLSTSWRRMI